jgi:hypothetical protein
MELIENTCVARPVGKKLRRLAVGVLAAVAISIPIATAVTTTAASKQVPASHRLASDGFTPDSVRLT